MDQWPSKRFPTSPTSSGHVARACERHLAHLEVLSLKEPHIRRHHVARAQHHLTAAASPKNLFGRPFSAGVGPLDWWFGGYPVKEGFPFTPLQEPGVEIQLGVDPWIGGLAV